MSPGSLCAAYPAQVSLTAKRVAKSSAAGEGRELSQWLGRWCSRCQCKCCQAGKAQGHAEGMLCRPREGLLLSVRGSHWWVQPLPTWFPYLRNGALRSGLLILWLAERSHSEAVVRRMYLLQGLPWASLDHVLWRNAPLATSVLHYDHPPVWRFLAEMSRGCLVCGNSAWGTGAWRCIAGASGKSSSIVCETWQVNVKAVALCKSALK